MRRTRSETRRRALGAVALTAALGSLTALAAGVVSSLVARTVVTPPRRVPDDLAVSRLDGDEITITSTFETEVRGRYGLSFSAGTGYARVGDIVARSATTVTRKVIGVSFGDLPSARSARWSGWYYLSPADLGLDFEDVEIATEFGRQPAWLVRAEPQTDRPTDRWAVLVHGRGVTRAETLRALPVFHRAGFTCLVISYRNDPGSPASRDGRYSLGAREWNDVASALDWARTQGAESFVIGGWSMGGATSLQALDRWPGAARIRGVALDSPVLDWRSVLRAQARAHRLPASIGRGAMGTLGLAWASRTAGLAEPIDLGTLDWTRRADELRVPILVQHSTADRAVPIEPALRLAELRPDLVTLHVWDEAQHVRLWNVDSARYEANLGNWLSALPD